jgi:hypothetical protein
MKRLFPPFAALLLSVLGAAQVSNRFPPIGVVNSAPTGKACAVANAIEHFADDSYTCANGHWKHSGVLVPSASSPQLVGPLKAQATNGTFQALPGTGTISAAYTAMLASSSRAGKVHISCGSYSDNVLVNSGGVSFEGDNERCVIISPANPSLPIFLFSKTTTDMYSENLSGVTLLCPANTVCADAIQINGPMNEINDWIYFHDMIINSATWSPSYGFLNGFDLVGRTIWTTIENVNELYARNAGVFMNSAAIINMLRVVHSEIYGNWNYGVYLNSTAATVPGPIFFDRTAIEFNGSNKPANCAGLYLSNFASATVAGGDYEANCSSSGAGAGIRLTGKYNQTVNVRDVTFNTSNGEWGIYNDTMLTTGVYSGNFFNSTTPNRTIFIATTDSQSNVHVGSNYNLQTPTYVMDGNGETHVSTDSPVGDNIGAVAAYTNPVTNNTIAAGVFGTLEVYGPSAPIKNITGGYDGRKITLVCVSGSMSLVGDGKAGQRLYLMGAATSETVAAVGVIALQYSGALQAWIETSSSSNYHATSPVITGIATYNEGTVPQIGTPTAGHAACIKSAGPPVVIGYCSNVPRSNGECTCN